MKVRHRKPTAAQQKVIDMVIASLAPCIERIQTQEEADQIESYIWKLRTAGQLTDLQYQTYLKNINEIYKDNNWVKPTT